jgi:hypothetical protein
MGELSRSFDARYSNVELRALRHDSMESLTGHGHALVGDGERVEPVLER